MKRAILTLMVILITASFLTAATTGAVGTDFTYPTIVNGMESDYFQFNEKGVYVPQTDPPAELKAGWIVLSGQEPVTIRGKHTTIVLQRESILTVGSTRVDSPSYYLVAGSASFLVTQPFSGTFEVSTPVGIYKLTGPGEMFVSSDYAELIFSLGGEIRVMNTITRQLSDVPAYTYLNLADPFLHTKQISRQTFETLSINPDKRVARTLPSASVEDGVVFKAPAPLFETPVVTETPPPAKAEAVVAPVAEKPVSTPAPVVAPPIEATVTVPLTIEGERELQAKELVIDKAPQEGLTLTVSITAEDVAEALPVEELPVVIAEPMSEPTEQFDFYIVHTNDVSGQLSGENIGYARLATLLDWGRSVSDRNLVLDAGNTVSGTPVADAFKGEPIAVLLDMLGYDAIAPGPGDYAFGLDRLVEAAKLAGQFSDLKVLAANVLDTSGNLLFKPFELFELEGFTVGVIGLSIPPESIEGVEYLNDTIIEQAQNLVNEVAAQSDFVVVLGNLGTTIGITSTDIVQAISGIDLFIDGEAAKTPAGGRTVGNTLIVNAGSQLTSVGIVGGHVVDGVIHSVFATRIAFEDVENPTSSALAKQYGITQVPANEEVQQYIDSQQARYTATQRVEEPEETLAPVVPQPPEAEVTVAVEQPVEEVVTVEQPAEDAVEEVVAVEQPVEEVVAPEDDPLTIKEPLGIVTTAQQEIQTTLDWGLTTAFTVSRDGFTNSATPKSGISLYPFFHKNSFEMGLQAFFLTDGSLFSPSTYSISNLSNTGGIAGTLSTAMSFIDYVKYGEKEYPFYLLADDTTPIAFGNRMLVDNLGVYSGPYEDHLGLYSTAQFGRFKLEVFADDLYLTNYLQGKAQVGGGRLAYSVSPSISLGLSTLLTANSARTVNAYPAFDLIWRIKNERKLQLDAFVAAATKVEVNPFSFTSVFDNTQSGISGKLPNFLMAGGVDLQTLKFNARIVGAVQNSEDGLLALGAFNQTNYSGLRMLDSNAGIYFTVGAEGGYQGEHFGLSTSWYIPVDQNLSRIIPIDGKTSSGDRFAIEATYSQGNFEGAIGWRRVGFMTAIGNLFSSPTITSGALEMIRSSNEGLERNSQPYLALRYSHGLFNIFSDLSLVPTNAANPMGSYTPRVTMGTSVTIGKSALESAADPALITPIIDKDSPFNASLSTAYTRSIVLGGTDEHYLSVRPKFSYTKGDAFSVGIGPELSLDFTAMDVYSHDDSPFKFGSTYPSTIGKVYDGLTDALSLLDHLTIGTEEDTFNLYIGRDSITSMGPLVQDVSTRNDALLESPLALTASLDSKVFDIDLFVQDITELQLGGMRLGVTPLKNYAAEVGLSAIGSLKLSDSDKQMALLPSVDLFLPVMDSEKVAVDAVTSFTTMVGYKVGSGFVQNFYDSTAPTFLGKFNNYLFSGGMRLASGDFTMGLDIAMQEGALSYGMFNALFLREQKGLLADLSVTNPVARARGFAVGTELSWSKEKFSIDASYLIPLSASFSVDTAKDLFTVASTIDLSWFDVELSYGKRGFLSGVSNVLTGSTGSLLGRAKTFLFDPSSAISAGIAVNQGPMTFKATVSSLATFTTPAGSWNQQDVATVSPAITLGVDINLF